MKNNQTVKELIKFIDSSPSCFHVVKTIEGMLDGFEKLDENQKWNLLAGHKYYVVRDDSSIIAFTIPYKNIDRLYISAAHSDSPTFKIKPNAEMTSEKCYTRLNTEKYGGMNMSTWLDRPLSIAGRVVVKQDGEFVTKLVNIDRDLLLIPSVAIHMKRDVNDGFKFDAQIDTIPLLGDETADKTLMKAVAENAGVDEKEILGSDLYLYSRTPGAIWGMSDEFVSHRALDDLQCVFGTVTGFMEATLENDNNSFSTDKLTMCCVFDNEEVGSLTSNGADSTFLQDTIGRICESLDLSDEHKNQMIAKGMMVSADNAHAVHPNHPEYADPTNRPAMNKGIVLKFNGAQKYTTNAISEAMFKDICDEADVPVQTYANKSNIAGGSTLGNISNRHISIRTVDIGLPQLAMHSAYETAGVKDTEYLISAMKIFFS